MPTPTNPTGAPRPTVPSSSRPVTPAAAPTTNRPSVATNAATVDGLLAPVRPTRTPAAKGVELAPGSGVFLSPKGHFTLKADQAGPADAKELGEALLAAASLTERGGNVFAQKALPLEQKSAAYQSLRAAFVRAQPGPDADTALDETQALQLRASAAPLLLDLALSLDAQKPGEGALQEQVFQTYLNCISAETHGLNRNFMVFDLMRVQDQLPEEVQAAVELLLHDVAPTSPPYESWFANGNDTLRIAHYLHSEFWDDELNHYVSKGFTRTNQPDGTVLLTRTYEATPEGASAPVKTKVELHVTRGARGLFDQMGDPDVHCIIWSGHADYGREIPRQLQRGKEQVGDKVFFALQCGGKGVHDALLARYTDLQVVASRNASYSTGDWKTFLHTLDGFAKRASWADISRKKPDKNYYFPSDTLMNKQILDADGDGQVDAWDRVVAHNSFRVAEDVASEFQPKDPGQPAHTLSGEHLHDAALRLLRLFEYNEWGWNWMNERVLAGGFFEGTAEDPILRITDVEVDGKTCKKVEQNHLYAHMGWESLGGLLGYELGTQVTLEEGRPLEEARASGVLLAAEILQVDMGRREQAVFQGLVKHAGLPQALTWSMVHDALMADDGGLGEYKAGSQVSVAALGEALSEKGLSLA